jgi:hypothetical protein
MTSRKSYAPPKQRIAGLRAGANHPDVDFSGAENLDIRSGTLDGARIDGTACIADCDTEIVDEGQIESDRRGTGISKRTLNCPAST